jgi:hypothetical protein
MIRYSTIRNRETDKNVAVIFHDDRVGRIVAKVRSADWPLQQAFDSWVDRDVVVQEPRVVGGVTVMSRRKIIRFDRDYLGHLLDRFVKRPYEARGIVSSRTTTRLDGFADQKSDEIL